jgi:hypothetical protein
MAPRAHALAEVPSLAAVFSTRDFSSRDNLTPRVTVALSGDGLGPRLPAFLDMKKG